MTIRMVPTISRNAPTSSAALLRANAPMESLFMRLSRSVMLPSVSRTASLKPLLPAMLSRNSRQTLPVRVSVALRFSLMPSAVATASPNAAIIQSRNCAELTPGPDWSMTIARNSPVVICAAVAMRLSAPGSGSVICSSSVICTRPCPSACDRPYMAMPTCALLDPAARA